ncbi:unnamed protein product [Coffea canephora]|uniref:RecQ mediated genome instability protein 1 OB-fold domain-containing protein n=1 Tax=Coffea canephora TaxID=49390 RepID=A0A068UHF7_COFCA|nr:unnamed protein product [Coffea canephora]
MSLNIMHLQGPKVLQISSVRDIGKSNMAESLENSSNRCLLRFNLTDDQTEIVAVEYSHLSSIPDDVVPGTKVYHCTFLLENNAKVRNGIVCLDAKVTRVLGGWVQSLYEEWEMNKKYSAFSRSALRSIPTPYLDISKMKGLIYGLEILYIINFRYNLTGILIL